MTLATFRAGWRPLLGYLFAVGWMLALLAVLFRFLFGWIDFDEFASFVLAMFGIAGLPVTGTVIGRTVEKKTAAEAYAEVASEGDRR